MKLGFTLGTIQTKCFKLFPPFRNINSIKKFFENLLIIERLASGVKFAGCVGGVVVSELWY